MSKSETCAELQRLQRHRSVIIKSRIMQANRLQAIIAGTIGYHSGMEEKKRQALFKEASKVISAVEEGAMEHDMKHIILTTLIGIRAFNETELPIKKSMERLAKTLPVASWAELPEQKGFGLLSLATVIGETGNLDNYTNPAKVWKRMGCAPIQFNDDTFMGATWKSGKDGKLPSGIWSEAGYSPRRRSVAYVIGENLIRGNFDGIGKSKKDGPYRKRYAETKARFFAAHPDYESADEDKKGQPGLRCHRHGMLLATKMLLRDLWVEWHKAIG